LSRAARSSHGSSASGSGGGGSKPGRALEVARHAPDDRAERREPVVEVVARRDLLRDDLVVVGLRLVGVGDRRDADLEVALRLRELLGHGGLLRGGELDVELREQHVEIRDRDTDDQVLLRGGEREVGLLDLALRLVVRQHGRDAEDRLARADREAEVLEIAGRDDRRRGARVGVGVVRVDRRRQPDVGEELRARLRRPLLRREPVRAGGAERRVRPLRLAVDVHQVLARGGKRGEEERTAKASRRRFMLLLFVSFQ
jgi:hypothetical protein